MQQNKANPGGAGWAVLKGVPLFTGLDEGQLDALAGRMHRRTFRAREVIFHQEDPGDTLYVIVEGSVKIYLTSSEGEEALLAVLGEGESFGELSLLDGLPRSASAAAMVSTQLFLLRANPFWEFLQQHPVALRLLVGKLAELVRRQSVLLGDALFLDLPGRLAKRLLDLAAHYGERKGGGVVINVPLTQSELAQMTGATRVSVNRLLGQLRDAGAIEWDGRNLVIVDAERLRRMTREML